MRRTESLDGAWRFQPDPYAQGEALGYARPDCDRRLWREAELPNTFDALMPALSGYQGTVWFARRFNVDPRWNERYVALVFEGVNTHARVWVNGQFAGEHRDGYLRFEIPVGCWLRETENTLVVCADNTRVDGDVPGLKRGWRPYGGIVREVHLVSSDPVRITAVASRADHDGLFEQRLTISNGREQPVRIRARVRVESADRTLIADLASEPVVLEPGEAKPMTLSGRLSNVQPWTPATPTLYTAQTRLEIDGSAVDAVEHRIGFRTVARDGVRLLLNGAPLYLTGYNRHEDSARRQMCPDPQLVREDLLAMKASGSNFVRLCHYPHHPSTLDLCDELGLLVMSEIPLYWWDHTRAEHSELYRTTLETAKRQLSSMIERDRNHPSIAFWSVSNETEEKLDDVADGNRALVEHVKALDPNRLAVHVSCHWPIPGRFDADDVVCLNGYPSLSEAWRARPHAADPERATLFWQERLEEMHALHPDKPILVTEFGGVSFEGVRGTIAGEDVHARDLALQFAGMQAPYVAGATIWCWADHPWPEDRWFNSVHLSPYGVVTRERRRLAPFHVASRMFRERQGVAEPGPRAPSTDVAMVCNHLRAAPAAEFPEGYSMRPMRSDEIGLWTDVQRDAEKLFTVEPDLFEREFGDDPEAWKRRCFFVVDARGVALGTISAWYSRDFLGKDFGRIHWFAIRPEWQGKKLARPALSHAMRVLAEHHERAWLATSIERKAAIKLYLDYGFVPLIRHEHDEENWRRFSEQLDHPALARRQHASEGQSS